MKMSQLLKPISGILKKVRARNVLILSAVFYFYTTVVAVFEISQHQYTFSAYEHRLMEETLRNKTTLDKLKQQMHAITSNSVKSCSVVIEPWQLDLHLVVNVSGNIRCALAVINNVLDTVRHAQLPMISQFESIEHEHFNVEHALDRRTGDSTYLDVLSKYPNIVTVLIAWHSYTAKRWDEADLPVKRFYSRPYAKVVCFDSSDSQECRDNLDPKVVFSSTPHYSNKFSEKKNGIHDTKTEKESRSIINTKSHSHAKKDNDGHNHTQKEINNNSNMNIKPESYSNMKNESKTWSIKTNPESKVILGIDNGIKTGSDNINALSNSNVKTSGDSNTVGQPESDRHRRETKTETQKAETESSQSSMLQKNSFQIHMDIPFLCTYHS